MCVKTCVCEREGVKGKEEVVEVDEGEGERRREGERFLAGKR